MRDAVILLEHLLRGSRALQRLDDGVATIGKRDAVALGVALHVEFKRLDRGHVGASPKSKQVVRPT